MEKKINLKYYYAGLYALTTFVGVVGTLTVFAVAHKLMGM